MGRPRNKFALLIGCFTVATCGVLGADVPGEGAVSPPPYVEPVGDPVPANPDRPPSPPAKAAKKKRILHRVGVEIGSDTNPDLLTPTVAKGINRIFDSNNKFTLLIRDDRLGVNIQNVDPVNGRKRSFSFRQNLDFPTLIGLGGTRNGVYKSLNQKTPSRDVSGYVTGFAMAFNYNWGVSLTHNEYLMNGPETQFNRDKTEAGLSYSPLGDNRGRPWSYTIDPYLTYEKFHGLHPIPGQRYESFGYSIGTSFYVGLEQIEIPHLVGPERRTTLDRVKFNLSLSNSEVSLLNLTFETNVTAYFTRHAKFKLGFTSAFQPETGVIGVALKVGASLRLGYSDLHSK